MRPELPGGAERGAWEAQTGWGESKRDTWKRDVVVLPALIVTTAANLYFPLSAPGTALHLELSQRRMPLGIPMMQLRHW